MMKLLSQIVVWLLLLSLAGWGIYQYVTAPETAYILIQDVYNGFDLKKEMEKKFTDTKSARQRILDSLVFNLNIMAKQIESEQQKNQKTIQAFNLKREEYLQRKQMMEEDNDALARQYDQQILTQLNQYVKDYGKEQGYTYIFGNDGNGSLMYAADAKNITQPVIEYVNNRYKGVK